MQSVYGRVVKIDKYDITKEENRKSITFQDIEVEDNNNYFANGCLVHNSGTPYRSDGNNMKMYGALGYPISNSVTIKDLIDMNYLCPFTIEEIKSHSVSTQFLNYNEIYDAQITNNSMRHQKIADKAQLSDKPVLIMIDKIAHGEKLQLYLPKEKTVFFNGKLKKKSRDKLFKEIVYGKYDFILSTKVLNEGVNIKKLRTLIYGGSGKSPVRVVQQLGRVLRKHPSKDMVKVIHIRDLSKYFFDHYVERKKVLEYERTGSRDGKVN